MKKIIILLLLVLLPFGYFYVKSKTSDYSVKLTKIADNLYQINGTSIYLKTKYCNQYSSNKEIVFQYSGYGFSKGKLIFESGSSCDVEEVYEKVNVDYNAKVLTNWNKIEDVKLLLVPTRLN